MSGDTVKVSMQGRVALITLSDPATLNAMTAKTAQALSAALAAVMAQNARAVVLTGEGRAFCSGANLQGVGELHVESDGRPDAGALIEHVFNPLVTAIRDLAVPLVTAVNGPAAGLGCSLALLGDLIVAAESATFLQAFSRVGLVPDAGSSYLLPRMIGRARAMEMALLAEPVPARTALEWGLANRCVPDADLSSTAFELAERLARGPAALGLTRRLLWGSLDAGWIEQLHAERQAQRLAGRTADFDEGVRAFLDKRPPVFEGR